MMKQIVTSGLQKAFEVHESLGARSEELLQEYHLVKLLQSLTLK